jgi:REP element-mobilizing transposase RayT
MSLTLTRLLVQIMFSTRQREPTIDESWEPELFSYIGGIARERDSALIAAGAASDHVHLLIAQSKNEALSELVMHLKKDSSK